MIGGVIQASNFASNASHAWEGSGLYFDTAREIRSVPDLADNCRAGLIERKNGTSEAKQFGQSPWNVDTTGKCQFITCQLVATAPLI